LLDGKRVIVTGGTGSLGQVLVRRLLEGEMGVPEEVVVFTRSEALQHTMRLAFQHRRVATDDIVYDEERHQRLHFRIGDIRDYAAVSAMLRGADMVFHAAAMKQVPTCEYHPIEAFMTNSMGAQNIARAISEQRLPVEAVVGISTDKAVKPVNVMGMTKALQERILLEANLQSPSTRFIVARYGNVLASRGSVIPVFSEQIEHGGPVTVTTPEMTRFLLSLDEAVDTVFAALRFALAGETYVPRVPTARVVDVARALIGDRGRLRGHPPGREDPRGPGVRGGGPADV
jgi:UDP-glucose 4-epimerase